MRLRRLAKIAVILTLIITVALAAGWASLALWYRLQTPELIRVLAGSIFGLFGLCTIIALVGRLRVQALIVFITAFGVILLWWSTIVPVAQADWAPDVARQVTGTRSGDVLTLTNVRNFEWRSDSDYTEQWRTRSYDLTELRTLDLFMSYWAGPEIAHMILSFGFNDGHYLAWSIEVRRRKDGEFSPVADLFKSNPLVIVAAEERDVVRLRSNIRGEDVQLYRLRTSPQAAQLLLLEYVRDANALATTPKFYNSIATNCTTTVVKMMRAIGDALPLDWRFIVNGYLPDYAYKHGALDTRLSLPELKTTAHIDKRALAAGLSPSFSQLIRVGVPSPHE